MPTHSVLDHFREVWSVGFEFSNRPGERSNPTCLVGREFKSGRTVRLENEELRRRSEAPYPTDRESLIVVYRASEDFGCHLALGWPMPVRVLDLFAEFRNLTNGRIVRFLPNLTGAMLWHGLDPSGTTDRRRAVIGMPSLESCGSRVVALNRLLGAMIDRIDLPRALIRGRYGAAVARMERSGVPIDVQTFHRLKNAWSGLQDVLIRTIDRPFGFYNGRTFRPERWEEFLTKEGIPWPRLESGALALDDDTFREMARSHKVVALVRELRSSLNRLRLQDLTIGADGRNRVSLAPFSSKTGRNQPSSKEFIFGPSCWLRGLVKPEPGRSLAYIDWSQQEYGIAAALSGDRAMMAAYLTKDPYLAFGKQTGRIPPWGTKRTHKNEREAFKACVLGVLYGMGPESLASRIGRSPATARDLIDLHRQTYPTFWSWSDEVVANAVLSGQIQSVFGWTLNVEGEPNPRSLRNFPCQANAAEMLRLACSIATERGVEIVAPVHDAVLIEAPANSIDEAVASMQEAMSEASEVVLEGFRLRTDVKVVRWPDRYMDDRGREFWDRVMGLLPDVAESSTYGLCSA